SARHPVQSSRLGARARALHPPGAGATGETVEEGDRRLLALLGLAICFEGYGRSLPSIALAQIGRDLDASSSALSFALALVPAGALGVIPIGRLADAIGRRVVLLACVAGYATLGAGTGFAHALSAFVAWQAAARMFQEGALTTAAVIATEEMPAARPGLAHGSLGLLHPTPAAPRPPRLRPGRHPGPSGRGAGALRPRPRAARGAAVSSPRVAGGPALDRRGTRHPRAAAGALPPARRHRRGGRVPRHELRRRRLRLHRVRADHPVRLVARRHQRGGHRRRRGWGGPAGGAGAAPPPRP